LPIVSRTPAFYIIVVVKQLYTKHFRYAACGSPVTTCRVLSLGWVKERLQMYSTAASGLTMSEQPWTAGCWWFWSYGVGRDTNSSLQ